MDPAVGLSVQRLIEQLFGFLIISSILIIAAAVWQARANAINFRWLREIVDEIKANRETCHKEHEVKLGTLTTGVADLDHRVTKIEVAGPGKGYIT
jgi:hypothetical protein